VEHLAHILHLENIEYETNALEILARSGNGSLRDTLTLLDQAIIYSKNHVDVLTVTDMLGLVDPKFITDLFSAVFAKDYGQLVKYTKTLEEYEAEMVVDELIAYLKERMYNQDALFSTLVLDRFFRILSDSKYLFSINADGSFVLSLIFFKMIEALRIREVDQMIESLQKDVERPEIVTTPAKIKVQTATPEMAPNKREEIQKLDSQVKEEAVVEDLQTATLAPEPEYIAPTPIIDPYLQQFEELIAKIKDRNYELGECFTKNITYISYEDNVLTWESCADEDCKKALRHGYSVIKQLVREIFSFETKIKGIPCSKEPIVQNDSKADIKQPAMNEPQSTSMVEDAEMGGSGSCVTNCSETPTQDEINGTDITQEPMIQKAIELFEAKKVTVQSKI